MIEARNVGRHEREEKAHAGECERDSGGSAEEGEKEALGETGHDELTFACAEGGADGGFTFRGDGAGELEIGKIDAGDEEHADDGGKHEPECATDAGGDVGSEGSRARCRAAWVDALTRSRSSGVFRVGRAPERGLRRASGAR